MITLICIILIIIVLVLIFAKPNQETQIKHLREQMGNHGIVVDACSIHNDIASLTGPEVYGDYVIAVIKNDALGTTQTVYAESLPAIEGVIREVFCCWADKENGITPSYLIPSNIPEDKLVPLFVYDCVDLETLRSGQTVLLSHFGNKYMAHSLDGELIGFILRPRYPKSIFVSAYPLAKGKIIVSNKNYQLFVGDNNDCKSTKKTGILRYAKVDYCNTDNPFLRFNVNQEVNDPNDYLEANPQNEYNEQKTVEVIYRVPWMNSLDDEIEIDLSHKDISRLEKIEEEGNDLESDYISSRFPSLHKKIIKKIRQDMDDKSDNPDDGMVVEYFPPCFEEKVKVHPSHKDMLFDADDDEIEYSVNLM